MRNFISNYQNETIDADADNSSAIDIDVKNAYNMHNITVTLSALWVTRNLGGFSLSKIYYLLVYGVNKCL